MRNGITVHDVMDREFVGVSESDRLAEAAELMRSEPTEVVVVLRGSEPVGLLSARMAMAALLDDNGDSPVEALMEPPVSTVEPTASLATVSEQLVARGRSRLLVVDGEEAVGVVSDRDVLAAREHAETAAADSQSTASTAGEEAVGEPAGSTQSICEVCGSLAPELSALNGQQVCSDCRAY